MKKVIIVSGPTATGKTSLAVQLAKKVKGEIVNFDSLLFYRELNIGTAKPTPEEQDNIPHHLVGIRSIRDPMNAADFAREAFPVVESILQRNHPVFLVGGSGFYLQALVEGMWHSPTTPPEVMERSDALYSLYGIAPFLEELRKCDPASLARLHANDHYRVRRAVEHFWAQGVPFSDAKDAFKSTAPDWDLLHIHLDIPRDEHQAIIRDRTMKMLSDGLIQEVEGLLKQGFSGEEKPMLSIGYKEVLDWLNGVYGADAALLIERIVINTRRLAKSQRTWFKRKVRDSYDPRSDLATIEARVTEFISQA